MADTKTTKKRTEEGAGWTDAERDAMKERAKEVKAAKRRGPRSAADAEAELLAKIAEMPQPDRSMGERFHAIVKATAPDLTPRLWYGMPAYSKDGKLICFFQAAAKFKARYATFGFEESANLDEGDMWATSFALKELTDAAEAKIVELLKRAVS